MKLRRINELTEEEKDKIIEIFRKTFFLMRHVKSVGLDNSPFIIDAVNEILEIEEMYQNDKIKQTRTKIKVKYGF